VTPPKEQLPPRDTDAVPFPLPTPVVHDGRTYDVAVRVFFDGVEYLGRLWFIERGAGELAGLPDRGLMPGRTLEEALDFARRFRPDELVHRLQRALSEKRRFHELRSTTDEVLGKIRYLNQLAVAMRAGVLDVEGAAQEIDLTEQQLHSLVKQMREVAGVEE
jgi:hypothetical protein